MKITNIYKLTIYILITIFVLIVLSFSNRVQKRNIDNLSESLFINHLLNNTNKSVLKDIGISHADVVNKNIQDYDTSIISNKNNNYYKILQVFNESTEKDFICIYKYSLFSYKQVGLPIEFNNITNSFILETTDKKNILFIRDLIGLKTSPLDLTSKLYAYVFNKNDKHFSKALDLIENSEEYLIIKDDSQNYYKKYHTKSDILLTNSESPTLKVLTNSSESVSSPAKNNLSGTPPYSLDFDVIKTSNSFDTYIYDSDFHYFLLGYIKINSTGEIVGIIKKSTKIINNNFTDTYTVIKTNGVIYEIYNDYSIEKLAS